MLLDEEGEGGVSAARWRCAPLCHYAAQHSNGPHAAAWLSALPITAVCAEPAIIRATISASAAAVVTTSAAAPTAVRSAETLVSSTGAVIVAIPVIVAT